MEKDLHPKMHNIVTCLINFSHEDSVNVGAPRPAIQLYALSEDHSVTSYSDFRADSSSILNGAVTVQHDRKFGFDISCEPGTVPDSTRYVAVVVRVGAHRRMSDCGVRMKYAVAVDSVERPVVIVENVDVSDTTSNVDWFIVGILVFSPSDGLFWKDLCIFPDHKGDLVPQLKKIISSLGNEYDDPISGWTRLEGSPTPMNDSVETVSVHPRSKRCDVCLSKDMQIVELRERLSTLEIQLNTRSSKDLEDQLAASHLIIEALRKDNRELKVNALADIRDGVWMGEDTTAVPPNIISSGTVNLPESIKTQLQFQEQVVNEIRMNLERFKSQIGLSQQFRGIQCFSGN
jgi:hypothetical protein